MKKLTWNLFAMTGNPESYLLFKEVEKNGSEIGTQEEESLTSEDQEFLMH